MSRLTRHRGSIGLALCAVLLLGACGGDGNGEDAGDDGGAAPTIGGSPTECEQVDELTSGHPGFPPDFIQMVTPLADELGFFAEECLDVELIDFESGVAAFRAMAAGELDLGLSGSVSPILAFGQGADAVGFAASGAYVDFQVVSAGDITSCEQLEGRRVATDGPGGLVHAITEQYLAQCGIDINQDVELIVGEPETFVAQFAQGNIDATSMHIDERIFAEDELGKELTVLANTWEEIPDFHYTTFATAREVFDEKREQFVRFTKALLKTGRWLSDEANRDDAITVMAEVSEQPEAVIEEALDTFGNRFPTSCDTMIPVGSYEFLIDLQVQLGNLEEPFPVEDFLDTSVCDEAEQMLDEEESA
ncbi:MAG TPA: ABC transporter substrate-binding protein [Actinomycetota bacterium]|nr:ABC transporter substrate-binding protein [Actinomycetota bacterium]